MYVHRLDTYARPVCFDAAYAGVITFTDLEGFLI